jgi:transcriptional regulator with XRE-family HTH domain
MPKKKSDAEIIYGERLKAVRLGLGYDKIRAFAEALDVHEDTYRAWERGDNMVPPGIITKLFELHSVDHNWIYLGDPSRLPFALASSMPAHLFREPRRLAPMPAAKKRA